MRYLVLSDIHANLEALETVIAAAAGIAHDRVLVLGDLVGYGADPNAVVERVRDLEPVLGDPRQPRQGRRRPRAVRRLQRRGPQRDPLDLRGAHATTTATGWPPCRPGRWPSTTCSRSATARRSTRTPTCSTRPTCCARCRRRSRRLCLFGHTHVQVGYRLARVLAHAGDRRPATAAARSRIGERPLPDQPGIGRTAARRRSARRLRASTTPTRRPSRSTGWRIRSSERAGAHSRSGAARGAGAAPDDRR